MVTANTHSTDRLAELKAFDETKAGVKGLVDAGISTIPHIFIHPLAPFSQNPTTTTNTIPVIDLGGIQNNPVLRKDIVEKIGDASEKWGFFQVVNHGIPLTTLEGILDGIKGFFEQDVDVKKGYYTRDYKKNVLYNSNFDLYAGLAANWRDTITFMMAPNPPSPEDLPVCCRNIVMEYSEHVMKLGNRLFELLSEALGLEARHLNKMECGEGLSVLGHYYPACPQPELTVGIPKHSDYHFLSVLVQDQIGGLQVLHDAQWCDVPPMPGALVVNIGDLLQLVSNDKLKSVEHRVLANKIGPRISVACFLSSLYRPTSRVYGPIKELLSVSDPPKFRETTMVEYTTNFRQKALDGISALEHFRL